MAAHMKSDKRDNTTISSNIIPLFCLSFAFIYDYPPLPLHTSFITLHTSHNETEECRETQRMIAEIFKY
jgi:hypothetical protein